MSGSPYASGGAARSNRWKAKLSSRLEESRRDSGGTDGASQERRSACRRSLPQDNTEASQDPPYLEGSHSRKAGTDMHTAIKQAEYIWLDGATPVQKLRSKSRIVALPDQAPVIDTFPEWSFDGSSTSQASGND